MSTTFHTTTVHADPIVVGLRSTAKIYYALCRNCGAYTGIRNDPLLAQRKLGAGLSRGVVALQHTLPLTEEGRRGPQARKEAS